MKRSFTTLLTCLALVGCGNLFVTSTAAAFRPVVLQDAETKDDSKKDDSEKSPAAEAFAKSKGEYNAAMQKFQKTYMKASGEKASREDLSKIFTDLYPKTTDYVPVFMKIASDFPEEPEASKALIWVVTNDRGPDSKKAIDLLLSDYIDSKGLGQICRTLSRPMPGKHADALAALDRIIENSPHHDVVGNAVVNKADCLGRLKGDDFDESAVEALYQRVIDDFADVGKGRRSLKKRAEGALFEIRYLAIGKTAPDIEGSDFDGQEFKLSDYRGKVVVIDFWGDW